MQLLTALLSALIFAASTNAFTVPIYYPANGAIWRIGSTQPVAWDSSLWKTSDPTTGVIYIWMLDGTGMPHKCQELAQGFHIWAGSHQVQVPKLPTMPSYVISLSIEGSSDYDYSSPFYLSYE